MAGVFCPNCRTTVILEPDGKSCSNCKAELIKPIKDIKPGPRAAAAAAADAKKEE